MRITGVSLALCLASAALTAQEPVIAVKGPTVVAFFAPVTEQELAKDVNTNEALADFQHFAAEARGPLSKAGVSFHEVYARAFRIRQRTGTRTYRTGQVSVGYYLVEPGKKARVQDGVITESDLFDLVREYFGIVVR